MRDVRRRDMVCGVFSLCVSGEVLGRYGWYAIAVGRSNVGWQLYERRDERRLTLALAGRRISASEHSSFMLASAVCYLTFLPHSTFTFKEIHL